MYTLEVNSQTKYEFYISIETLEFFRACALFKCLCKTKINFCIHIFRTKGA